jgi:hypothetical protein
MNERTNPVHVTSEKKRGCAVTVRRTRTHPFCEVEHGSMCGYSFRMYAARGEPCISVTTERGSLLQAARA